MQVFKLNKLTIAASAALITVMVHGETLANCPPKPAPGGPVCDKKDKKLKDEGDIQQLKQMEQVKDLKDTNKSEDEIMRTNGETGGNGAESINGGAMSPNAGAQTAAQQALDNFQAKNPAPPVGSEARADYDAKLKDLQMAAAESAKPQTYQGGSQAAADEKNAYVKGSIQDPDFSKNMRDSIAQNHAESKAITDKAIANTRDQVMKPLINEAMKNPEVQAMAANALKDNPQAMQSLMNNKDVMNAAVDNIAKNPQAMNQIMSNPEIQQAAIKAVTSDPAMLNKVLSDPALTDAAIKNITSNPQAMQQVLSNPTLRDVAISNMLKDPAQLRDIMSLPDVQKAAINTFTSDPQLMSSVLSNPQAVDSIMNTVKSNPQLLNSLASQYISSQGIGGIASAVLGGGGAQVLQQMLPQLGSLVQGMMGGGGGGMGSIIPSIAGMAQSLMGGSRGGSAGYAASAGGGYNTVIYTYSQPNTIPASAVATYPQALNTVQTLYYLPDGTVVTPQQVQAIQQIRSASATQANLDAYSLVQAYRQQQALKPVNQQYVYNSALGSGTVRTDVQNNTLAAIQLHREQLDASALLTVMIERLATQMMSNSTGMTLAR